MKNLLYFFNEMKSYVQYYFSIYMHITDWYYRITQCDIPSLIIYITYIFCLNNENAIVNPRGYDYFRNR